MKFDFTYTGLCTLRAGGNRIPQFVAMLTASVDSRLVGKSATTDKTLFVGYNTVTPAITRNPTTWIGDVSGITAISPWNEYTTNTRAGTLLSPDVMVNAAHYLPHLTNGTVVHFITMESELFTRTIVAQTQVGSTDLYLSRLSSPLPATIKFAKVFPVGVYTELALLINTGLRIPVLMLDQQEKALVADWTEENSVSTFSYPIDAKRLEFSEEVLSSDSGNFVGCIYGDDLIAVTVLHHGGAGDGSSINANRVAINSAMTSIGSAYQLTEVTLLV